MRKRHYILGFCVESYTIKKRFEKREDGMIVIQAYDEQGKKEEVGGDYCVMIEK